MWKVIRRILSSNRIIGTILERWSPFNVKSNNSTTYTFFLSSTNFKSSSVAFSTSGNVLLYKNHLYIISFGNVLDYMNFHLYFIWNKNHKEDAYKLVILQIHEISWIIEIHYLNPNSWIISSFIFPITVATLPESLNFSVNNFLGSLW